MLLSENEQLLEEKMLMIRKKNEDLLRRQQEIEEDKKNADVSSSSVKFAEAKPYVWKTRISEPRKPRKMMSEEPPMSQECLISPPKNVIREKGAPPSDPRSYLADPERDGLPNLHVRDETGEVHGNWGQSWVDGKRDRRSKGWSDDRERDKIWRHGEGRGGFHGGRGRGGGWNQSQREEEESWGAEECEEQKGRRAGELSRPEEGARCLGRTSVGGRGRGSRRFDEQETSSSYSKEQHSSDYHLRHENQMGDNIHKVSSSVTRVEPISASNDETASTEENNSSFWSRNVESQNNSLTISVSNTVAESDPICSDNHAKDVSVVVQQTAAAGGLPQRVPKGRAKMQREGNIASHSEAVLKGTDMSVKRFAEKEMKAFEAEVDNVEDNSEGSWTDASTEEDA